MSIWICCWKLVSGYVYMDMLDFVELCCWIYMLDLMKYVVGHAIGYVCMYICV